ncbi:hypothetical protein [Streptomyces manipurensis]|uniref:hypothetical protein n=1 Tax=Streptomyces manipurensis TaxID=1077945 RepID=UPI003C6FC44C
MSVTVPTPLDVATRALQPATGLGNTFRARYQQGIRTSPMNPHTRLVALTLASLASDTGEIPSAAQPGMSGLADATGLPLRQVVVQVRTLQTRGWLTGEWTRRNAARFQLALPLYVRSRLT